MGKTFSPQQISPPEGVVAELRCLTEVSVVAHRGCKAGNVIFDEYDPSDERRREALFALGNGVLAVRFCSPDAVAGEHHYPGTYRAGCYNRLRDVILGEAVENESLVNLPNWLPLSFRVNDDPDWLSLDAVEILDYRQTLGMRHGIAARCARFRDRHGRVTLSREERLVSMADPNLAGFRLELRPENWSGAVAIRSAIDGGVENRNVARHRAYGHRHLDTSYLESVPPDPIVLGATTRQSGIKIATAVRTRVSAESRDPRHVELGDAMIADYIRSDIPPHGAVVVAKIAGIATSRDPGIGDAREAALAALRRVESFDELRSAHVACWQPLWRRGGIEMGGGRRRRAVALHRLHILQTISPHSTCQGVGFPARGWQEAYRGQIFWDDIFVFPFLNARFPELARSLLLYRYRRLDAARLAARRHGFAGAMFPWRSASSGREETPRFQINLLSGRWMRDDTRLQRHIGAAIAFNVWQYHIATGDMTFLAEYGAEIVLEIARFWASFARRDHRSGRYDIRGVIGPDEYDNAYPDREVPGLDNNACTNVMAVWTLRHAARLLILLPAARREEITHRLRLADSELERWRDISRRMRLVFHADGVLSQFEGFEHLKPFDGRGFAERHPSDRIDWVLEARGESIDAYQATKQADVLMLLYLLPGEELSGLIRGLGYDFTDEHVKRTAAFYLARITQESSLSRVVCAGAMARLDPATSWAYFQEAMKTELYRGQSTSSEEGLHLGAMAATIDVLQRHYLGLQFGERGIALDPHMPRDIGRVRMALQYHGGQYELDWSDGVLNLCSDAANSSDLRVIHSEHVDVLKPGRTLTV